MTPIPASVGSYNDLLEEAAAVTARTVERLRVLIDEHPAAIPAPVIEQLLRVQSDPESDRRVTVRLPGGANTVPVTPCPPAQARVLDHSPDGLSLLTDALLLPGAVLSIRMSIPGGEKWFTYEVRHCRPEGSGWVVGCELVRSPEATWSGPSQSGGDAVPGRSSNLGRQKS